MIAISPKSIPEGTALMNNKTVCHCSTVSKEPKEKVQKEVVEEVQEVQEVETESKEPTLEDARELYKAEFEKEVPVNKKNDKEWILSKLN